MSREPSEMELENEVQLLCDHLDSREMLDSSEEGSSGSEGGEQLRSVSKMSMVSDELERLQSWGIDREKAFFKDSESFSVVHRFD